MKRIWMRGLILRILISSSLSLFHHFLHLAGAPLPHSASPQTKAISAFDWYQCVFNREKSNGKLGMGFGVFGGLGAIVLASGSYGINAVFRLQYFGLLLIIIIIINRILI